MKQPANGFRTTHTGSLTAASRERIIGTFRDADLRVVGNGHVHRYRQRTRAGVMTVWAPSLCFAPAAEPDLKFGPGTAGVVEYSVCGSRVDARYVAVPGVRGIADFFTLPEAKQSLEALDRRCLQAETARDR